MNKYTHISFHENRDIQPPYWYETTINSLFVPLHLSKVKKNISAPNLLNLIPKKTNNKELVQIKVLPKRKIIRPISYHIYLARQIFIYIFSLEGMRRCHEELDLFKYDKKKKLTKWELAISSFTFPIHDFHPVIKL